MPKKSPTPSAPAATAPAALYRSGAVARMLRMPVATLRVWERRYQLSQPATSPSGQRLYSAAEVQRLALLKRLSDLGHAIGSLARLDMAQLQAVAATHAQALCAAHENKPHENSARERPKVPADSRRTAFWRIALVAKDPAGGATLAQALSRPALLRRLDRPLQVLGPFKSEAEAAAALRNQPVDLLLQQAARLHGDEALHRAAGAPWRHQALCYRYASEASCERLAEAGVALLREPQSDSARGQWLQNLLQTPLQDPEPSIAAPDAPVPPRRWDDAALADFAALSSTVDCECPRHVAELLMQLSHFERYSEECQNLSPADARLHQQLRTVAAQSRASFETALSWIAQHEGLVLPPDAGS